MVSAHGGHMWRSDTEEHEHGVLLFCVGVRGKAKIIYNIMMWGSHRTELKEGGGAEKR